MTWLHGCLKMLTRWIRRGTIWLVDPSLVWILLCIPRLFSTCAQHVLDDVPTDLMIHCTIPIANQIISKIYQILLQQIAQQQANLANSTSANKYGLQDASSKSQDLLAAHRPTDTTEEGRSYFFEHTSFALGVTQPRQQWLPMPHYLFFAGCHCVSLWLLDMKRFTSCRYLQMISNDMIVWCSVMYVLYISYNKQIQVTLPSTCQLWLW